MIRRPFLAPLALSFLVVFLAGPRAADAYGVTGMAGPRVTGVGVPAVSPGCCARPPGWW